MKYHVETEMTLTHGKRGPTFAVRINYDVTPGRAQTYGQTAEAPEVGDMAFEVKLRCRWHESGDMLHDLILDALGDDLDWLLDAAREQDRDEAEGRADLRHGGRVMDRAAAYARASDAVDAAYDAYARAARRIMADKTPCNLTQDEMRQIGAKLMEREG